MSKMSSSFKSEYEMKTPEKVTQFKPKTKTKM